MISRDLFRAKGYGAIKGNTGFDDYYRCCTCDAHRFVEALFVKSCSGDEQRREVTGDGCMRTYSRA